MPVIGLCDCAASWANLKSAGQAIRKGRLETLGPEPGCFHRQDVFVLREALVLLLRPFS